LALGSLEYLRYKEGRASDIAEISGIVSQAATSTGWGEKVQIIIAPKELLTTNASFWDTSQYEIETYQGKFGPLNRRSGSK
jgi:hypothetical protein